MVERLNRVPIKVDLPRTLWKTPGWHVFNEQSAHPAARVASLSHSFPAPATSTTKDPCQRPFMCNVQHLCRIWRTAVWCNPAECSAGGLLPIHKVCWSPSQRNGFPELQRAVALHLCLEFIGLIATRTLPCQVHKAQQLFQRYTPVMIAAAHARVLEALSRVHSCSGKMEASCSMFGGKFATITCPLQRGRRDEMDQQPKRRGVSAVPGPHQEPGNCAHALPGAGTRPLGTLLDCYLPHP